MFWYGLIHGVSHDFERRSEFTLHEEILQFLLQFVGNKVSWSLIAWTLTYVAGIRVLNCATGSQGWRGESGTSPLTWLVQYSKQLQINTEEKGEPEGERLFFLQLQYSFHKLIASKSDVLDFLDMFLIPNLWVSWIILHLRFKTLFLKVSQLWSFTPPCHSWHLTNRLRKSEKVTALFHQEAYSLHLSWVLTASFFISSSPFSSTTPSYTLTLYFHPAFVFFRFFHYFFYLFIFLPALHWGWQWVEVAHHISESAQSRVLRRTSPRFCDQPGCLEG